MKRLTVSLGVAVALAVLMSSTVLAGGPPAEPDGVCAVVAALPDRVPQLVIDALNLLFGC